MCARAYANDLKVCKKAKLKAAILLTLRKIV